MKHGISAPEHSRAVSGQEMCITNVFLLLNKSEAHSFKGHKLLQCFKRPCLNIERPTINRFGLSNEQL